MGLPCLKQLEKWAEHGLQAIGIGPSDLGKLIGAPLILQTCKLRPDFREPLTSPTSAGINLPPSHSISGSYLVLTDFLLPKGKRWVQEDQWPSGTGHSKSGFQPWFCHLQAVWSWAALSPVQTGALKPPWLCEAACTCHAPAQAANQHSMFTLWNYCWNGDSCT